MELNEALEKILALQDELKLKNSEIENLNQQHIDLKDTHDKTLLDMKDIKESNMRLYLKLQSDVVETQNTEEPTEPIAQDWDDFVGEM